MNQRYRDPRRPVSQAYKNPRNKKTKKPPVPAVPCVVRYVPSGHLMAYRKSEKRLYIDPLNYFEFPSRRAARTAIWHTTQAGVAGSHEDYELVPLDELVEQGLG